MLATVRIVTFSKHENLKILKWQPEAVNRRKTDNTMARKKVKGQTLIYKTLHRKQNIEQNKPNVKRG